MTENFDDFPIHIEVPDFDAEIDEDPGMSPYEPDGDPLQDPEAPAGPVAS